jgi:hypothetical protein
MMMGTEERRLTLAVSIYLLQKNAAETARVGDDFQIGQESPQS